jgi:hypothetical protein
LQEGVELDEAVAILIKNLEEPGRQNLGLRGYGFAGVEVVEFEEGSELSGIAVIVAVGIESGPELDPIEALILTEFEQCESQLSGTLCKASVELVRGDRKAGRLEGES